MYLALIVLEIPSNSLQTLRIKSSRTSLQKSNPISTRVQNLANLSILLRTLLRVLLRILLGTLLHTLLRTLLRTFLPILFRIILCTLLRILLRTLLRNKIFFKIEIRYLYGSGDGDRRDRRTDYDNDEVSYKGWG